MNLLPRWFGLALLYAVGRVATATPLLPTSDATVRVYAGGSSEVFGNSGSIEALNVPQFEDRGIVEYDVTSLTQPITSASLWFNSAFGHAPFPFAIGVFGYNGDGIAGLGDFNAGTLISAFTYSGESTFGVDVTNFIQTSQLIDSHYAGFNFRFSTPSNVSLNGPFLAWDSMEYSNPLRLEINGEPHALFSTPPAIPVPDNGSTLLLLSIGVAATARLASLRLGFPRP